MKRITDIANRMPEGRAVRRREAIGTKARRRDSGALARRGMQNAFSQETRRSARWVPECGGTSCVMGPSWYAALQARCGSRRDRSRCREKDARAVVEARIRA